MAQNVAQQNATFLALANWRQAQMEAQNGTTYQLGKTLTFTMPSTGGWARGIWIKGAVDINLDLTAGTVATSKATVWALFNQIRVKLGSVIHQAHPYVFELIYRSSNNAGQRFGYGGPSPAPWAIPGGTGPILYGSANGTTYSSGYQSIAGDNLWYFTLYIPLQMEPDDVSGLVPLGASANELTLELDPCVSLLGNDPLKNPIVSLTSGAVATIGTAITSTITAMVDYTDMNSLQGTSNAGIVVPDPVVSQAYYVRDTEVPLSLYSNYVYAKFEQPYEFARLMAILVDGYTATQSATAGDFANQNLLTGLKLMYDGQNTARQWDQSTGGLVPFYADQLRKYGNLFRSGEIMFDFASGHDPRNPSGQDLLNAALFTQARVGITYESPGTTNFPPYIHLMAQYLVPQAY